MSRLGPSQGRGRFEVNLEHPTLEELEAKASDFIVRGHPASPDTFYLVIAVVGVIMAIGGQPATLVVTALAGAYSAYLFRGGRFVIWIW